MKPLLLLGVALVLLPAPAAGAADGWVERGRQLYFSGCAQCHGPRLEGVEAGGPKTGAGGIRPAGPPLRGVGELAADFELRTGYMPLDDPEGQPLRSKPSYGEDEIRALVAFVGSFGGPKPPEVHPERGSLAEGFRLFREHCAGCHQIVGEGGVVTGALAPPLKEATPTQVAEAVRIGPYLMPSFPESQISGRQLDSLVAYVERSKHPVDRGGWGIGHLGPIPEGMVAWLLAGTALLLVARLIGERRR